MSGRSVVVKTMLSKICRRSRAVEVVSSRGRRRGASSHAAGRVSRRRRGARAEESDGGGLHISVSGERGAVQIITVSGSLPVNRTTSYRYEMKNPPLVI